MLGLFDALYSTLAVPAMGTAQWAAGLWSPKVAERRFWLSQPAAIPPRDGRPRLWVHAASMGEFEQIIPILELLKGAVHIVATFFSPSGANHGIRRRDVVDVVRLLPLDGRSTMRRFVREMNADAVLIGRYDVWRNMVLALEEANTPMVLVNATYPSAATRARGWVADTYGRLTDVVAVTPADGVALEQLIGRSVRVLADSRYDRIHQAVQTARSRPPILPNVHVPTLVVGSSWTPDVDLVLQAATKFGLDRLRLVVVPHEPTKQHLQEIERKLVCRRFSECSDEYRGHVVVDSVGALLSLYAAADLAFIGGGFGAGVHSLAEPAGFGLPCACGPNIRKSREGQELAYAGGVRVVPSASDVLDWLTTMVQDVPERKRCGAINRDYLESRTGTSAIIARQIRTHMTEHHDTFQR